MIENQSRLRSAIETGLRDLFGGAISGVVSIVYCVSYAAFIFSGPLAPWLGYGIAATFISTTIGALVVALRSSLPFTIAGPDSSTSVVTATLVAAFVQWLVANGATDHILGSTLFLMALSSALVGILSRTSRTPNDSDGHPCSPKQPSARNLFCLYLAPADWSNCRE